MNINSPAFWGSASQVISSGTNFFISIYLIKFSTKEQFGVYGIIFATMMFCVGITNALINTQMTVNATGLNTSNRKHYAADMLLYTLIIIGLILSLTFTYVIMSAPVQGHEKHFITAVSLSIAGIIIHEYMRSYYFLSNNAAAAALIDLMSLISIIFIMYICYFLERNNLHTDILTFRGTISVLLIFLFIAYEQLPIKNAFSNYINSIKETLRNGTWALAGSIMSALQNQSIIYLIGFILGTSAVAEFNAARLLITPLSVLSTGLYKAFFPRITYLTSRLKYKKAKRLVLLITIFIQVTTFLYCMALYFSEDIISNLLVETKYNYFSTITVLWAIYFICASLRNYPSFLMQAMKLFKELTITTTILSALSLILIIFGVYAHLINGGIVAMIISELLLFIALLRNRSLRKANI